jgi:Uma2 family endonuclease
MSQLLATSNDPEVAARKRAGADQWDEVWDGVLHMPAMPIPHHQDLESDLEDYLRYHWAKPGGGRVRHQNNLAKAGAGRGWSRDYRIPDLILLKRDRLHIIQRTHLEGAPNVVVEIHSPDDESYGKLPWYLELGVPEVWIIHRDTKVVEIYLCRGDHHEQVAADAEGWVHSPETGVEMRPTGSGKLAIRMNGDDRTRDELPSE